jgi:hypothetical protein
MLSRLVLENDELGNGFLNTPLFNGTNKVALMSLVDEGINETVNRCGFFVLQPSTEESPTPPM